MVRVHLRVKLSRMIFLNRHTLENIYNPFEYVHLRKILLKSYSQEFYSQVDTHDKA